MYYVQSNPSKNTPPSWDWEEMWPINYLILLYSLTQIIVTQLFALYFFWIFRIYLNCFPESTKFFVTDSYIILLLSVNFPYFYWFISSKKIIFYLYIYICLTYFNYYSVILIYLDLFSLNNLFSLISMTCYIYIYIHCHSYSLILICLYSF